MKSRTLAGALALVFVVTGLPGCAGVNAWTAAALQQVGADANGAANNLHTADTLAAEGWARSACVLTLGGLSGAGNTSLTESAMKMCPPSGVSVGGVNVSAPVFAPIPPPPSTTASPAAP